MISKRLVGHDSLYIVCKTIVPVVSSKNSLFINKQTKTTRKFETERKNRLQDEKYRIRRNVDRDLIGKGDNPFHRSKQ